MSALELRPEVRAFAEAMERKLRVNEHRGGWQDDEPGDLFERAQEEMEEFADALNEWDRIRMDKPDGSPGWVDRTIAANKTHMEQLINKAADTANMLMMVVDVCRSK